jgi:hypothetical protein
LIDLTPALRKEALEIVAHYDHGCLRRRRGAALFKFRASPEARTALRSIEKPARTRRRACSGRGTSTC